MSNTFKFYPHEGTQEAIKKIKADASTPTLNSASVASTFRHSAKGKNSRVNARDSRPFHDKRPK